MDNFQLATILHTTQCHQDHTEYCGWFYEVNRESTWTEFTHQRWLKKADMLIAMTGLEIEDIVKVVSLL